LPWRAALLSPPPATPLPHVEASPRRARRDPDPHAARLCRGGPQRQGGRRGASHPRHAAHDPSVASPTRTGRDLLRLADVMLTTAIGRTGHAYRPCATAGWTSLPWPHRLAVGTRRRRRRR